VLYELLAGRRSFARESAAEVFSAVLRDEPGPLDAPTDLVRIVRRCLRKRREERFGRGAIGAVVLARIAPG
jgi:hypothetical protein